MTSDEYLYGEDKDLFLDEEDLDNYMYLKMLLISKLELNALALVESANFYDSDTVVRFNKIQKAIKFWNEV